MKKIVIIGLLLISITFLVACSGPKLEPASPEVINLAKCITEKDAVFYGTEWCPHCNEQKELFGTAIEHIVFVDCDKNRDACVDAGVQAYPTWIINGEDFVGTQQLFKLSQITNCPITSEESVVSE